MASSTLFGIVPYAALFCMLILPAAILLARALGLVDKPNFRKRHVGHVPLAGGIVLVVCLWGAAPFLPKSPAIWGVLFMSVPLFLLGAVDDRFDISARLRLLAQLSAGLVLVYAFDLTVTRLDSISSEAMISFGPLAATAFTLACICGVLNAINMVDGIDGLLGSVASLSLAAIGMLALHVNALEEAVLAFVTLGLLIGYLTFNLGVFGLHRRVFLGDSGSMVVGLILVVLLIALSQKDQPAITPTSAGWLLGLPLMDTVSVMVRRMVRGLSPFAPGRDHFHHVLQDLGLSRLQTLYVLFVIQLVFVTVGVAANLTSLPQYVFFWAFVGLTLSQFVGISLIDRRLVTSALENVPAIRPVLKAAASFVEDESSRGSAVPERERATVKLAKPDKQKGRVSLGERVV